MNQPIGRPLLPSRASEMRRSLDEAQAYVCCGETPSRLTCPISLTLLERPVFSEAGATYSQTFMRRWIRMSARRPHGPRDPITKEFLPTGELVPNLSMERELAEFWDAVSALHGQSSRSLDAIIKLQYFTRRYLRRHHLAEGLQPSVLALSASAGAAGPIAGRQRPDSAVPIALQVQIHPGVDLDLILTLALCLALFGLGALACSLGLFDATASARAELSQRPALVFSLTACVGGIGIGVVVGRLLPRR